MHIELLVYVLIMYIIPYCEEFYVYTHVLMCMINILMIFKVITMIYVYTYIITH